MYAFELPRDATTIGLRSDKFARQGISHTGKMNSDRIYVLP